jgi:pimeloyl-ACP methyl ester carboxylesterase
MELAEHWPGRLLSTSRGPVFVRHPMRVDHGPGVAPREDERPRLQPMLFVHGLGGESLDWADVATELSDRVDTYALDLPGFADSPLPTDGDLTLDGVARAIAEVASLIGSPVHLVGNSMGGAAAVRVAAEHPELVCSLTLLSPALPDLRPRFASAQLTVALLPVVGPLIVRAVMRADPEWMAKRVYALCYGEPAGVSPQRHALELAALRRRAVLPHCARVYRTTLKVIVSSYLERGPRWLWRQAAAVGVPTLLIYGGRDRLVDPRMAVRAGRTFRDAEVLRLPDVGHVAHLEQPAAVAGALREFLARPDLARGMASGHGIVVQVDLPAR